MEKLCLTLSALQIVGAAGKKRVHGTYDNRKYHMPKHVITREPLVIRLDSRGHSLVDDVCGIPGTSCADGTHYKLLNAANHTQE